MIYGESIQLPNIVIWGREEEKPTLYENIKFFTTTDDCHISFEIEYGKAPTRLSPGEREIFINYFNLHCRYVDFENAKLEHGGNKPRYKINIE